MSVIGREADSSGWKSLGPVSGWAQGPEGVQFDCAVARVRVTVCEGGLVRVRTAPDGEFGRDFSWAVTDRAAPAAVSVVEGADGYEVSSAFIKVLVHRETCRLTFSDGDGVEWCSEEPARGMSWCGEEVRCYMKLHEADHFFGLGEKGNPFDKRNTVVVNWNTDAAEHDPWTDPLYQTHPFVICLRDGRAYGVFFDNTHRSSMDLGKTSQRAWSFGAEGGEIDYYLIPGPTPADVIRRYAALVGTPALPPRWSLGYQQCRWSYESAKRAARIAKEFRKREIPCDTIYLDIDYMDGFRCFTWDPKRFPRPAKLMETLSNKGFKVVTIIDPGLKAEPGYWVYDSGIQGDHFLHDAAGKTHVGQVWPGESVFPDFTRAESRQWWGDIHREFLATGITGVWNDMNEPADLKREDKTLPASVRFNNEGQETDHRECHNVYGMQMARASFEGLARLRENERPFILTRAGYSGVQRYAAVWTGDNLSSWEHLRMSIPMLLNMSLSGIAFCGADIGGFRGEATPELFTRWLQLGIFYPLCRVHTAGGPEQDPWSYGHKHEKLNRKAIELRYRLMPYLYTEFQHASRTGEPVLRPLLLDFPQAPGALRMQHEFLFGRQLLVAPVVEQGAKSRKITLPAGDWYEFDSARLRRGGEAAEIPVNLGSIPMFARSGAIIPTRDVTQFIDDGPIDQLILNIFPGDGTGWFYNDDGRSYDYRKGEFTLETYEVRRDGDVTTIRLNDRKGREGFTPGRYLLRFAGVHRVPSAVAVASEPQPACKSGKSFRKSRSGWWFDKDAATLWVHLPTLRVGDSVEILHKVRTEKPEAARPTAAMV